MVLRESENLEKATGELIRTEPEHLRRRVDRWAVGREERLRHRGRPWSAVANLAQDLRLALRALAQRPLFSLVVIFVLALGIGATTAIFTLADAIILSPLALDEPDRLVAVSHTAPSRGLDDVGQTAAWHLTYEDENRVFEDIGMYSGGSVAVTGAGDPESVPALFVSSGVFRVLRLNPDVGRVFAPEDEDPGAPDGILLSHGYWQTRFGGDPGVLAWDKPSRSTAPPGRSLASYPRHSAASSWIRHSSFL